jgi:hypothetical protein
MTRALVMTALAAALLGFSSASVSAAIGSNLSGIDRVAIAPIECAQAGVPVPDSLFPTGVCTPKGVPVPTTLVA